MISIIYPQPSCDTLSKLLTALIEAENLPLTAAERQAMITKAKDELDKFGYVKQ